MAPGLLKLIATTRLFFVLIRILLGRVNSAMMSFSTLLPQFDGVCLRSVERAKLNALSDCLTVLPTSQDHFDLTAQEFRDALALCYRKPLSNVSSGCDGCGAPFSLYHALVCRKGGLIIQRHNEVRDVVGDLAALAWGRVVLNLLLGMLQ